MSIEPDRPNLLACQQCDALSQHNDISPGQKALCPSCGGLLFARKKNPIERTLAIGIAGLLLFIPATTLPIIGIGAAGLYNEASLIDCITLMINDGFAIIAFLVFMFTIAIPMVRLISASYLTFRLYRNNITPSLLTFFRSYHVLDSWTMIHVFFMGIVVSMYKLLSLADLSIGGGLISLVLLLLCSTLVSVTMDEHFVWRKLEHANVH